MRIATLLLLCSTLVACAPRGGSTSAVDRDVLGAEELQGSELFNVYETVQKLRPTWLRSRGAGSLRNQTADWPLVYMDNTRYGDLTTLRTIRTGDVREIRHLSAPQATQRFGTGHTGGVIQVMMK